jgi:hypothetical protein
MEAIDLMQAYKTTAPLGPPHVAVHAVARGEVKELKIQVKKLMTLPGNAIAGSWFVHPNMGIPAIFGSPTAVESCQKRIGFVGAATGTIVAPVQAIAVGKVAIDNVTVVVKAILPPRGAAVILCEVVVPIIDHVVPSSDVARVAVAIPYRHDANDCFSFGVGRVPLPMGYGSRDHERDEQTDYNARSGLHSMFLLGSSFAASDASLRCPGYATRGCIRGGCRSNVYMKMWGGKGIALTSIIADGNWRVNRKPLGPDLDRGVSCWDYAGVYFTGNKGHWK